MLTNAAVKAARPRPRAYKKFDEGGLFLFVAPSGLRSWRMKCRFEGRELLLTFGQFPELSLEDARDRRDGARRAIARGSDPRSAAVGPRSFEAAARAWLELRREEWTRVHAADVVASLERDVFPELGPLPLDTIEATDVLRVLRAVEKRGARETARRLQLRISAVFALAMSEGWAAANPAAVTGEALRGGGLKRRQPALTSPLEARELLQACGRADAAPAIVLASLFLALTGVRLDAVRGARWDEFEEVDWSGGFVGPLRPLWRVPAARVKQRAAKKACAEFEHLVPLSAQAVAVLRAARARAGGGELVFPGRGGAPIGEDAIADLYRRVGFQGRHVPHGWRASFSTILNERLPDWRAAIDLALGHAPASKVEGAYNRATQIATRRFLMQRWAEILLDGAPEVVQSAGGQTSASVLSVCGPRAAYSSSSVSMTISSPSIR